MRSKQIVLLLASVALFWGSGARAQSNDRSAYSYVRESTGRVTVISEANGSVEARSNLPISAGDTIRTEDPARAEIALADGNLVQIGGGTELNFVSLSGQQGSDDEVSALGLSNGSVILSAVGDDEGSVPRIDSSDATVYANAGSSVRVNADGRSGTAVIVRAGSVEVRTQTGSYTVRAGNYLTVRGDEEPEIARGDYSRDRFDSWAADRLKQQSDSTRSASSRYVGEDYSGDVQALDDNGDWDYSSTSSSYVWRPRVSVGWTPYSNGSWYYTPVGLTWWSWDSWGWYPNHYGNWFYDAGWSSWCWSPGYVYSPAWVYWGYSGSYLGWCPVGYYGGFYSPWWNNYYRHWSYPRAGLAFAINGTYSTRRVDLRGWNFTGSSNLGGAGRLPVVHGTRMVDRLGGQIAVSSRPIVVNPRAGGVRESLREFVREAPRTIERSAGKDSGRLEAVLARDPKLSDATVSALRERAVVADRGRLSGPGARELAPRGVAVVERGQGNLQIETTRRDDRSPGRTVITDRNRETVSPNRGRPAEIRGSQVRPETQDSWRNRSGSTGERPNRSEVARPVEREGAARVPESRDPGARSDRPSVAPSDSWRGGSRSSTQPREEAAPKADQSWRSRSDVPPARRVIDNAVPGRRGPEPAGRGSEQWREAPSRQVAPREVAPRERESTAPRERESAPRYSAPRERESPPRYSAPRERQSAPPDRGNSAPAYRGGNERRDSGPREAPRSIQRAPAPPPQAAPRAAPPPPRAESRSSSPRSAPAPSNRRPGRS